MTFQPGQSGNPHGRPRGARNRATIAAETLLDGEAYALTRKAIDLAKQGDTAALRLCIERILPARKDRPVSFEMQRWSTRTTKSSQFHRRSLQADLFENRVRFSCGGAGVVRRRGRKCTRKFAPESSSMLRNAFSVEVPRTRTRRL